MHSRCAWHAVAFWLGTLALVRVAAAQLPAAEEPAPLALETVVVTASRLPQPLAEVPASLSVVERDAIQTGRQTVGLEESLTRVPGVLVQSSGNFAQDARIQIRGFGTRAAFGVREIRVLVDGLPETQADGQTQLDGLDLGAVEHIEVLRGPASSLYGNAAGGVIQIFTEEGPDRPTAEVRLTGGSYGLGKYQVKGGGTAGPARVFLQSSFTQLDGYRDHSRTRGGTLNAKLRYTISDRTDVTLLINGVDSPTADDPGGLTRGEVKDDRRQARPLNRQYDAGESVQQVRVGAVVERHTARDDLTAYAYVTYRDFDSLLAIPPTAGDGNVTFHRVAPGGGLRYAYRAPVLGWRQTFSTGLDVQYQDDARRRFENQLGARGALKVRQTEQVTSVGPYVRQAVYLRDDLELSAGVRYDAVRFRVDVDTPPHSPESGSETLDAWSPAGGARYSPWPWLSLFGNVGTAFQVPTTTELANPDGAGFNRDLDPQRAISYELGARGEWSALSAGLAAFRIDLDDELIPFESTSGRTAFRNAGRSRRYGVELDWQARPLPPLRWSGAVTFIDAAFRHYRTDVASFDGNDEPGIPSWQVYQELAYQHPSGLFAALELFAVDGYYADDANHFHSPGYELLGLRAEYRRTFGHWTIAPFIGLANLTDARYDGTVRLNALGERFFEPAPGFNAYGGLAVSAQL